MPTPPLWIRLLLIVLVVAAVGAVVAIEELRSTEAVGSVIAATGWLGPAVFIVLHIPASLAFLPRAVMGGVAGVLFGLGWGMVWAHLGAMVGAMAGFVIARYVTHDWLQGVPRDRLAPLMARLEAGGWKAVLVARLMPVVPHALVNYGIGLTTIRIRHFALGSVIGMAPTTVAFVNLGVSGRSLFEGDWGWVAPALFGVAVLVASWLATKLIARRQSTPG